MKSARFLAIGAIVGLLPAALAAGAYDEPALIRAISPGNPPATVQMADSPAALAVRQAADPSSAIAAYSSAAPEDITVKRAFVQRMIDFGMPEMVDAQAKELIRNDPSDGLAWAVSAYMNAKRDQLDQAFKDIAQAVRYQPTNVFVVRTAAQLTAWYDTQTDKRGAVTDEARTSLEAIRRQLANDASFADAYSKAAETYRQATATVPQQPAAPPVATVPATPYYYDPEPTYVNNYYYNYDRGYDYADWYPSAYRPAYWWWPTFASVVIINKDFDHRRRCDDLAAFVHRDRHAPFVRGDSPARVGHGRFEDTLHGRTVDPDPRSPSTLRTPTFGQRDPRSPTLSSARTPSFGQRQAPTAVTSPPAALRIPSLSTGARNVAPPISTGTVSRQPAIARAPTQSPRVVSTPRSTSTRSPVISRAPSAPRVTGFAAGGGRSTFSSSPSRGMQGPVGTFRSSGMSGGRSMR